MTLAAYLVKVNTTTGHDCHINGKINQCATCVHVVQALRKGLA